MITTWNAAAILEICTIYQYYRVNLFLVWYKLYLAKYEQGELVSFDSTTGFFMDEETRQVLGPVTQTAISTYNIMCAVGKIEGSTVWHSIPKEGVPQTGEEAALYIYPPTIRAILDSISNADTPAQFRLDFYNLNPIPGARWNNDPAHGWLLTNANDIWPAGYNAQQLEADVDAYQNLLTRVSGRLPRSFVSHYVWSGKASKTGLVCSDPAQIRLNARFGPAPAVQERRRNVYGQYMEAVPLRGPAYLEDDVVGRATVKLHWSLEKETSALEMISGAASFVGEHSVQPVRLQVQGKLQAHIAPGTMLYKLVDAPRPATA